MISLATSDVNLTSWKNVLECLITKHLGRGKFVYELEERFVKYFGVKHAIAVANGTLADIVMLATLKAMRGGEEVILPAFTFVAHANSVIWSGLKPVFCDVDVNMTMDVNKLVLLGESNTLCTFPAHILGKDCSIKFFGLPANLGTILEDCCEAMGGDMSLPVGKPSKKLGTYGIAGSFSMFPSHTITTGEGGLIITNDDEFNEIARSIMNHGKWKTNDFTFGHIGINAKMSDLNAAIGCSLVDGIDKVNRRRRMNVETYNTFLGESFYATSPHCYPVFYEDIRSRDMALSILRSKGIDCRKLMGCIPDYPMYKKYVGNQEFPMAKKFADTGLFVPVHQNLKHSEIERICEIIYETR